VEVDPDVGHPGAGQQPQGPLQHRLAPPRR
jgi:hypothetical protein